MQVPLAFLTNVMHVKTSVTLMNVIGEYYMQVPQALTIAIGKFHEHLRNSVHKKKIVFSCLPSV